MALVKDPSPTASPIAVLSPASKASAVAKPRVPSTPTTSKVTVAVPNNRRRPAENATTKFLTTVLARMPPRAFTTASSVTSLALEALIVSPTSRTTVPASVGGTVGSAVGDSVGAPDGAGVGINVGTGNGIAVGRALGRNEGDALGSGIGTLDGRLQRPHVSSQYLGYTQVRQRRLSHQLYSASSPSGSVTELAIMVAQNGTRSPQPVGVCEGLVLGTGNGKTVGK